MQTMAKWSCRTHKCILLFNTCCFFFPILAQLRFCWGFLRIHIQYSPLQGGFGGSNYLLLDLSRPIGTDPQRLLIQQFLFGQALTAFHRDQKRSIEEHGLLGILLYHLEACWMLDKCLHYLSCLSPALRSTEASEGCIGPKCAERW